MTFDLVAIGLYLILVERVQRVKPWQLRFVVYVGIIVRALQACGDSSAVRALTYCAKGPGFDSR